MSKLIIKKRIGLPETNSSSSHSIVISELKRDDSEYLENLSEYIKDDVLFIPDCSGYDFGNGSFSASNDIMKKISFAISLYSSTNYGFNNLPAVLKFLDYLRSIIKSFTGVKNVIFESIDKYNEMFEEHQISEYFDEYNEYDYDYRCVSFGIVDHQSCDLSEELFQNRNTLKDFIFSKDSWLFLGSDCYDMDSKISDYLSEYYKLENNPQKFDYASIDFEKNLGRIDIPLDGIGLFEEQVLRGRDNLIDSIFYKDGSFILETDSKKLPNALSTARIVRNYKVDGLSSSLQTLEMPIISFPNREGIYLYLTSENFRNTLSKISEKNLNLEMPELIELAKKSTTKEDWLEYRIFINSEDYGKF